MPAFYFSKTVTASADRALHNSTACDLFEGFYFHTCSLFLQEGAPHAIPTIPECSQYVLLDAYLSRYC